MDELEMKREDLQVEMIEDYKRELERVIKKLFL